MSYAIAPHVSGGVPVVSQEGAEGVPVYYINGILGTTLALVAGEEVEITPLSAFGNPATLRHAPMSVEAGQAALQSESAPSTPAAEKSLIQRIPVLRNFF